MTLNCQLSRWVSSVYPQRTWKRCSSEELPYCLTRLFHCFSTGSRGYSCCHDHYNLLMRVSKRMFCALWQLPRRILTNNRLSRWMEGLFILLVKDKGGSDNKDFQLSWIFSFPESLLFNLPFLCFVSSFAASCHTTF